jgi:hypothetical protein
MASLILIGKVALVAFVVLGCTVLVFAYLRKRRTVRPVRDPSLSGYADVVYGGVPPTPQPEWAEWAEASGDDPGFTGPDGAPSNRR